MGLVTDKDKESFLKEDLPDALKWLCVGAITWQAHPESTDHHHLRGHGMFTSYMQARALYEFFGKEPKANRNNPLQEGNTVWAGDFTKEHWQEPDSPIYSRYMRNQTPGQKRVFHLSYCRSQYSGGNQSDESQDLKNQVVELAKDLIRLTEKFISCVKPEYKEDAQSALDGALSEAQTLASEYEIANPLA